MQTICFYAVPKRFNNILKSEKVYEVKGFISSDNPLYNFGKSRKLMLRDLFYVIKNAREISVAFYDAFARHYFDKCPGSVNDYVMLSDAELVKNYKSLLHQYHAAFEQEEFMQGCYEISLKQKLLDLSFWHEEEERILDAYAVYHYHYGKYDLRRALKEYFYGRDIQKELGINLLLDRLGRLDYASFKQVAGRWSANDCNYFGVIRRAEVIKPVFSMGERKLDENPYHFAQKLALSSNDMSAGRLSFLMLRACSFLHPDYDFYYKCAN